MSNVYNGQGQRVKKAGESGPPKHRRTVLFHYGLNGERIGETVLDNRGNLIGERDYMWLDGLPLAQSEWAFAKYGSISSESVHCRIRFGGVR